MRHDGRANLIPVRTPEQARFLNKYKRVSVPEKAHPLVKILFAEMRFRRISIRQLAERSGIARDTIRAWRFSKTPMLPNVIACLNVVGIVLAPVYAEDVVCHKCGSPQEGVQIHGHLQCKMCGFIIEGCCE